MQKLPPSELHRLRAAEGWMGLGLRNDAESELNEIAAEYQRHPDVLEIRWSLLAQKRCWRKSLAVARELMEVAPDRSSAWLHLAYSSRRVRNGGGLNAAWNALFPAATKFPDEPIICFNLACYSCQLKRLDEARGWLRRARKIGNADQIKFMALLDKDLKPLWPEIKKW